VVIGDSVIYEGRRHVVVGVTPFSVTPFKVLLEDPETQRQFWTEPGVDAIERAALRAVDDPSDHTAAHQG
jgi:hypothetical protein